MPYRKSAVVGCACLVSLWLVLAGSSAMAQNLNSSKYFETAVSNSTVSDMTLGGHGCKKSGCSSSCCGTSCGNSCCSSSCCEKSSCNSSCCSDSCCSDSCCQDSCCDCCCEEYCPHFVFSGGYLLMAREYYRNSPIVTDAVTGETLLSTGNFEGRYDPGFEIRGRLSRFEVRYFQISNDVDAYLPGGVNDGLFLGGQFSGDAVFSYGTDLYNGELNFYLCDPCQCVRLLTGFRYMRLNEQFNFVLPASNLPIETLTQTRNDLYTWQLGVSAEVPKSWESPFSLCGYTSAGVGYSDTRMTNIAPGAGNTVFHDSSGRVAFIGEVGVKGQVNLGPVSLDAGYQILFINGVAMAAGQPVNAFGPSGSIVTDDLIYHGLTTSATVRW